MSYNPPTKCPTCGDQLHLTKLTCNNCRTEVTGEMDFCKYCMLDGKNKLFLDTFLKCRGNIKDVERELSISYPTVKGLLDELLSSLFENNESKNISEKISTSAILDMLENNKITADEAAKLLKKNR